MSKMYLFDANILIYPHRQCYSFDIAPGFWSQLVEKAPNTIVLIDRIRDEIYRNEDDLSNWLKKYGHCFIFKSSADKNVHESYKKIINLVVEDKQYKESAKRTFADRADSWLCAHALAYDYILVTQEEYAPESKNIIKIPNICVMFGIEYIDLFQAIKALEIVLK